MGFNSVAFSVRAFRDKKLLLLPKVGKAIALVLWTELANSWPLRITCPYLIHSITQPSAVRKITSNGWAAPP